MYMRVKIQWAWAKMAVHVKKMSLETKKCFIFTIVFTNRIQLILGHAPIPFNAVCQPLTA